jgi:hypothetical protein
MNLQRSALVTMLVAFALIVPATSRAASWGRPFTVSSPRSLDIIPSMIGFSSTGSAAIAYGVENADEPSHSNGYIAVRSAGGGLSRPRKIPNAQVVLATAFDGSTVELLTATSGSGSSCCSSAMVQAIQGNKFKSGPTLVRTLTGATLGALLPLAGTRLLAVVAGYHGVWVSLSPDGHKFTVVHELANGNTYTQAMAATLLHSGGSAVVWSSDDTIPGDPPHQLVLAQGTSSTVPGKPRTVLTVAANHGIGQVAVAPGPSTPTLAWIDSWSDKNHAFQAQVGVADAGKGFRPRDFSLPGEIAAGLAFAGDQGGDQELAWKGCQSDGSCRVRVVVRPARGTFDNPQSLGQIDPSQDPVVAVGPNGTALIAWIRNGHVFAAVRRARSQLFGAPHQVSKGDFASDLTVAFGPTGQALATWTEGPLDPVVQGAVYRAT